jgi:hypothetical protein
MTHLSSLGLDRKMRRGNDLEDRVNVRLPEKEVEGGGLRAGRDVVLDHKG